MIQYFLQITLLAIINQQLIGCQQKKDTPLTISALYPNLTHYDTTIKTGNAFLYKHSQGTFLVTTTHLLFDSPSSSESLRPSKIKCNNIQLNNYCYSRFFDVAIFKIKESDFSDIKVITKSNTKNPKNVIVSYFDTNSNSLVNINSLYNPSVNSNVKMGTINQALIPGSSGSAVVDSSGKLVGMICCQGDEYQNMTLVIPVETIDGIINQAEFGTEDVIGKNIDNNVKIHPNILTTPLNAGHLNMMPDGTDITSGELVVQSSDPDLKPFDIITEVNNQKVGASGNRIANICLQQAGKSLSYKGKRLKKEWRKKYGAFPRKILSERTPDGGSYIISNNMTLKTNFSVSEKTLTVSETNFVMNQVVEGSSFKVKHKNTNKISFFTVSSLDINKKKIVSLEPLPDINNIESVTFYPTSSIYTEKTSDESRYGRFKPSTFDETDFGNTTTPGIFKEYALDNLDNEYKKRVILFVIKHWAFLVGSKIANIKSGHAQIIWANMIKDLFDTIPLDILKTERRDIFNHIAFKIIEFNNEQASNLLNILIQNIILRIKNADANFKPKHIPDIYKDLFVSQNLNTLQNKILAVSQQLTTDSPTILNNESFPGVMDARIGNVHQGLDSNNKVINTFEIMKFEEIDSNIIWNVKILSGENFKADDKIKLSVFSGDGSITISQVDDIFITENADGNTSFNSEGLSNEAYHLQNNLSKFKQPEISEDNRDLEIALCLKEITKINETTFSTDSDNDNYLYYPSFYGLLKSFWDHAHINLSGIMNTLTPGDFPDNSSLTLTEMQPEISVWRRRKVFTEHKRTGGGSDSWICTYLFNRKMLTQEEYDTFNRFGAYAFKAHPRTMKGYWSYLNDLMEKFSKQASDEDWDHFKPWITKTLSLIHQNKMEEAYDSFCQEVYYLTEHYNADYSMFDLHQMDVYYGVFNRFSPVVKAC